MIKMLLSHPLFLTIVFAGFGAQILKIIFFFIKSGRIHALDLVATGSMPSSHSSLVAGLTTIIYLTEGLTTTFFVAFAFSMVTITDALGVRRTAGEEGRMVHKILKKIKLSIKEPHYSLGHTPLEVVVGIVIGFLAALAVNLAA